MMDIRVSPGTELEYSGWKIGYLELRGLLPRRPVAPAGTAPAGTELELRARRIETKLRETLGGLSRKELAAQPPLSWYDRHFGTWGKAYPVLLQAHSIASRKRRLEMPDPLVLALFAAELDGFLLTAGHDLDELCPPLVLDLPEDGESLPTLGGTRKEIPKDDLVLRDSKGSIASVLLGPDDRSRIRPETKSLLVMVYAPLPVGTELVRAQLESVAEFVCLACPEARRGEEAIIELSGEPRE